MCSFIQNGRLLVFFAIMLTSCSKKEAPAIAPELNYIVSTLAGNGAIGFVNGSGITATFNNPHGVTLDAQGVLYVADADNHCIRKITANGVVITLAGTGIAGYNDGIGANAQFSFPTDVAIGTQGALYIADRGNNCIRKITSTGIVTTWAGVAGGGYQDGPAATARFNMPSGLAIDGQENLYVSDTGNNRIRKITSTGIVSTLAGGGVTATPNPGATSGGFADGQGVAAKFLLPNGITVDAQGNVYVADGYNNCIRKITPAGTVTTLAGITTGGTTDGVGGVARFFHPYGVAVDAQGIIYVTDYGNSCIIRRITASGLVTTIAGQARTPDFVDGPANVSRVKSPIGIATSAQGRDLYIADAGNHCIRQMKGE